MAKTDQASNILLKRSISPKAVTTSQTGTGVDVQGYEAVTFILSTGHYTDGEYAVLMEDSDDNATYAPVLESSGKLINVDNFPYSEDATDYLITSLVSQDEIFWVGYVGNKRYVRARIYANMAMTGMVFAACFLLGDPHSAPTPGVS